MGNFLSVGKQYMFNKCLQWQIYLVMLCQPQKQKAQVLQTEGI